MPLIIVTGLPTSGKSTRAKQLHTYLSERIKAAAPASPPKYRLHLISDQTLSIRRAVYDLSAPAAAHTRSANASEKDARAATYAAVKRALSDRDIVVLDGLNYIKGWRYQLFCEAKAARTPCCVLQVGCSRERARAVNEARLAGGRGARGGEEGKKGENGDDDDGDGDGNGNGDEDEDEDEAEGAYEPANWENLVFRYEEPNPMTRWDSPLFALVWEDGEARAREVFEGVWEAVAGETRKAVRPNQATVQRSREADGDYLYVLDRETQDVVRRILERQGDDEGGGGGEVGIPRGGQGGGEGGGGGEDDLVVELPASRRIGLPQLQRLRRAFMGLNRGGIGLEGIGNMGPSRIRESFVGYLNDNFEKDG
ncbi:putative RNA polymerase ii elongator complex subunit protein [Rosellinia necatrix]|uniref:Putative RNA polymerase ii elongator complex subunit protein n=1 Tax=Rosellinia necatrix TaxID=77044 RepID=A0A1W2TEH5_ROSNE|nr:putative RNA polymerase ii elongator complex subunit protein [Rosellinia necatrix]